MANSNGDRVAWVDSAKAIAVLSVVLLHAAHWVSEVGSTSPAVTLTMARFVVPLPVFFVLSGILSGRAVIHAASTWGDVIRRIAPLLWVYWIWQPAIVAYRVIGSLWISGEAISWRGELARLVASPLRPNGELWYLWALALYLMLAWATRRVRLSLLLPVTGIFFVAWGGWGETLVGRDVWHALGPGIQGLPQFILFTLLGARLGPELIKAIDGVSWRGGILLVAAWQAAAAVTALTSEASTHLHNASGVVQILLGVAATLVIARGVTSVVPTKSLQRIGRDSLPVYLSHTLVIVVCLALAERLGSTDAFRTAPALVVAFCITVGTLVPLTLYRYGRGLRASWAFDLPSSLKDLLVRERAAAPLFPDPTISSSPRQPERSPGSGT